jgi:hypothetical protein
MLRRAAATMAWPEAVLNSSPMCDDEPYSRVSAAGRVMETVAKGAAAGETARKAF